MLSFPRVLSSLAGAPSSSWAGAVLVAGAALGCTSGGASPEVPAGQGGEAGIDNGTGGAPTVSIALRATSLEDGQPRDAMKLAPLETVTLEATTKPPISRVLRFALTGDALDAVLADAFVVTTALTGGGQTTLTAPSAPRSFNVRVTTTGADPFNFPVAVPSTGVASLGVWASYDGRRSITQYTATAWENATCASLSGAPPDDGVEPSTDDSFPVPLEVTAGVPLAVILRVGRYIWGCATLDAVSEGAVTRVDVPLSDVPIKLDRSSIRFTLTLDRATTLTDALAPTEEALLLSFVGDATDDVEALLDAMHESLTDPSSFSSTRRAETWDRELRDALPNASELVRGPLRGFISDGLEALSLDEAFVGELEGAGEGAPPTFTLDSVFGMTPDTVTVASKGEAVWTAQADDTVLIGVGLELDPAGFLLGAATKPALTDDPGAAELSDALASALPCKAVAATLVAHGEATDRSFGHCDEACTEELCRAGVKLLYSRAAAPAKSLATLELALTGAGGVGLDANLTALSGNWLGKLTLPPVSTLPQAEDPPAATTVSLTGLASARDPSLAAAPSR